MNNISFLTFEFGKIRVEKSMIEKSWIEKFRVEISFHP